MLKHPPDLYLFSTYCVFFSALCLNLNDNTFLHKILWNSCFLLDRVSLWTQLFHCFKVLLMASIDSWFSCSAYLSYFPWYSLSCWFPWLSPVYHLIRRGVRGQECRSGAVVSRVTGHSYPHLPPVATPSHLSHLNLSVLSQCPQTEQHQHQLPHNRHSQWESHIWKISTSTILQ